MIKKITNEGFKYVKLTPEEMKARGILGRLVGPCADFTDPTRNGRKYSQDLWENVFNNPIMQEKFKNKVCFGELGHPEDRTEIDMEKIAVSLPEQPLKNDKGQLLAVFDILDTPNGRILKTLCDYGSRVGVSSRGQGDLITDGEGNESVDPDTYECECWDIVLIPAVENARMQYVKEGLDTNKANLNRALTESFSAASDEDKKIMKETLKELNININEGATDIKEISKDQKEVKKTTEKAIDKLEKEKAAVQTNIDNLKNGLVLEQPAIEETPVKGTPTLEETPVEEETPAEETPVANPATAVEETPVEETPVTESPVEETPVAEALTEATKNKSGVDIKAISKEQASVVKDTASAISDLEDTKQGLQDKIDTLKDGMKLPETPVEDEATTSPVEEKLNEDVKTEVEDKEEDKSTDVNDYVKKEKNKLDSFMDTPVADDTEDEDKKETTPDTLVDSAKEEDDKEENTAIEQINSIIGELEIEDDIKEKVINKLIKVVDHLKSEEEEEEKIENDISTSSKPETTELEVVPVKSGSNDESHSDIKVEEPTKAVDKVEEAVDDGANELIKSLTEALKSKSELENNFKGLQEKLAVSDAKVSQLIEENKKLKDAVTRVITVAKKAKDLKDTASKLEESITSKDQIINDQKNRILRLVESKKQSVAESTTLTESIKSKDTEFINLKESIKSKDTAINDLTTQLQTVKEGSETKTKELTESLAKQTKATEAYKTLASNAVNKYIEVKANMIGLTSTDIKRKLGESYKLSDVDQVCEDLKSYQLNVSRLPFSIDRKIGIKVNESVASSPVSRAANKELEDDNVDEGLVKLAGI